MLLFSQEDFIHSRHDMLFPHFIDFDKLIGLSRLAEDIFDTDKLHRYRKMRSETLCNSASHAPCKLVLFDSDNSPSFLSQFPKSFYIEGFDRCKIYDFRGNAFFLKITCDTKCLMNE